MKFVNVGNALKVTCVGFAAGVVLRVVQMLFFFDYDTGFYTDGGLMAWLSFGVPVASGLLASWMCFRSRRYFGPYTPRRNMPAGLAALFSGLALLASAALQWMDLRMESGSAGEYRVLHLLFLACCALFGLTQVFVSLGFFQGRNGLRKAPLLYLTGVLWGVSVPHPGLCVLRQVLFHGGEPLRRAERGVPAAVPVLPVQALCRGG